MSDPRPFFRGVGNLLRTFGLLWVFPSWLWRLPLTGAQIRQDLSRWATVWYFTVLAGWAIAQFARACLSPQQPVQDADPVEEQAGTRKGGGDNP